MIRELIHFERESSVRYNSENFVIYNRKDGVELYNKTDMQNPIGKFDTFSEAVLSASQRYIEKIAKEYAMGASI